ncbi:MAG: hypothetical protein AAF974_05915 [Cyanobacteria bacterium P01_E01_bin.34]
MTFADVMNLVELLTVEDRFQLSHLGLTVVPHLPRPKKPWPSFEATGSLLKPDGSDETLLLRFTVSHFNTADPQIPVEQCWQVAVSLPELQKDDVPVGSHLLVSEDVRNRLTYR